MNQLKEYYLQISKRLPIRLLLIVPFVLEIVGTVGLTGYLSIRNGQSAVTKLAIELRQEISDRTKEQILTFLDKPYSTSQTLNIMVSEKLIDLDDPEQLQHILWRILKENSLENLAFTTPKGINVFISRMLNNQIVASIMKDPTSLIRQTYTLDEYGKPIKLINTHKFEPLTRAWYKKAIKAQKAVWNDFYISASTGMVSISISQPIYNQNKELLGVQSSDFRIKEIYQFLQGIQTSQTGQIFIIDRQGNLVASSVIKQPFIIKDQKVERIPATKIDNYLITSTAQILWQRFNQLTDINTTKQLDFFVKGEKIFVQVSPIIDHRGIDWLSVVVIPESHFMAEINANTQTTILICLIALMVAIIMGIYTSQWLTKPILNFSQVSLAIAGGNLDQVIEISHIKELQDLAFSFNLMAKKLRESFMELAQINEQLEEKVATRTAELKDTLTHLKSTQAQLIQSEKISSLGKLVAGIAHEINNPISFIHGNIVHISEYLDNLLELISLYQTEIHHESAAITNKIADMELEFIKEDVVKILASMKSGTERIKAIVLSLRNFSRLDESQIKTVNIHDGIDSALLILQYRLETQPNYPKIEVIRHDGNLPPVECYPGQLNQVLMNILSNAIDALEESYLNSTQLHPQIQIRTTLLTPESIEIAIADNGPGIPESIQAQIFDPFFTTKPVGKGTGMGLSISYQIIVEQHHGQLKCHSTEQGTEFLIQIPISQSSMI